MGRILVVMVSVAAGFLLALALLWLWPDERVNPLSFALGKQHAANEQMASRMSSAVHVQNVRGLLGALSDLQRNNSRNAQATIVHIVSDELMLLNGLNGEQQPRREHASLCAWRPHIEALRKYAEDRDLSGATDSADQKHSFDRTLKMLDISCSR